MTKMLDVVLTIIQTVEYKQIVSMSESDLDSLEAFLDNADSCEEEACAEQLYDKYNFDILQGNCTSMEVYVKEKK